MAIPKTLDMPLRCLYCQRPNDALTGVNAEIPDPGSLTICWACHCVSVFEVDASGEPWLRKPSDDELVGIMADPDVRQALHLVGSSRTPGDVARQFI